MTTERDTQRLMDKYGVAWWKFDEESGSQIIDSKGNFNGTAYNVTRVEGVSGNALSFNGSSSQITFTTTAIPPYGEKSIRFRILRNGNPSGLEVILENGFSSSGYGTRVQLNTNGGINFIILRGISGDYFSLNSSSVCDGEWHDVLVTFDGTQNDDGAKIYIDDFKLPDVVGKVNFSEPSRNGSNNFTIGKLSDRNERYLNAQLDDIQIYNKALTYEDLYPNKTLIRSDDNTHYMYDNGLWQPIAENPTQQDYEEYGMYDEDLQQITKADLLALPNLMSGKPKVRTFKYS